MKTRTIIQSIFTAVATWALFAGCSKEDMKSPGEDQPTPVAFNAAIQAHRPVAAPCTAFDADGNAVWKQGDDVAVCMLASGGQFPDDVLPGGLSKKYAVDPANGTLIPDDGMPLFYPLDGTVDFIAVSPYMEWRSDASHISVPLTDQSTVEGYSGADKLYSDNAKNIRPGKDAVELRFRHLFSKLMLDITLGEGLTDGTVEQAVLNGMPNMACYAIQDGSIYDNGQAYAATISPLRLTTPSEGATGTYVAIVSPQQGSNWNGRTIVVTVDGVEYTGAIPDTDDYASNTMYVYPVTVRKMGITVGTHQIEPWIPVDEGTGAAGDAIQVGKGIEKVLIKAGTFLMGSPANEENRKKEETQHTVTLTHDFYMSKYQITNAQYAEFLNATGVGLDGKLKGGLYPDQRLFIPSSGDTDWGLHFNDKWTPATGYDNHPAILVTWYGAMEYARWIGASLPTEAQWEYACRAGTTTAYFFGDDASLLGDYAWYSANGEHFNEKTHPVGILKPNPWGLYDMCGNVREWCLDHWTGEDNYLSLPSEDPVCTEGVMRIYRGGSHYDLGQILRSANRAASNPTTLSETVGFRVVFN